MIKRFLSKCSLCGHANTLRVSIGINARQRHAFECQGCGEEAFIELEIDFVDRESIEIPGVGSISGPRITNAKLENAEWTDEEGTITNLDPSFLVPEEDLHKDRVFAWMNSLNDVAKLAEKDGPRHRDIIDEIGMPRGIREGISAAIKAVELRRRGRDDLAKAKLEELSKISGGEIRNVAHAVAMISSAILGKGAADDVYGITALATRAFELSSEQFVSMRVSLMNDVANDFFERQLVVLKDYLRGYDQFNQAWVYAAHGLPVDQKLQPSARGLDTVRMFYGTAFEHLSSGLVLPACINNILSGRPFDQFSSMDLKKYLTTDKAGRARCIEGRPEFAPMWSEFDSTLRNGSYHQGLRLKQGSKYVIQYRTGDSQSWREISYAEYLLRCNKIMMCLMKLLALQIFVFGPAAFEEK